MLFYSPVPGLGRDSGPRSKHNPKIQRDEGLGVRLLRFFRGLHLFDGCLIRISNWRNIEPRVLFFREEQMAGSCWCCKSLLLIPFSNPATPESIQSGRVGRVLDASWLQAHCQYIRSSRVSFGCGHAVADSRWTRTGFSTIDFSSSNNHREARQCIMTPFTGKSFQGIKAQKLDPLKQRGVNVRLTPKQGLRLSRESRLWRLEALGTMGMFTEGVVWGLRFSDSWGLRFSWKSVKKLEFSTLFQK